jgi:hypothetical protein
MKNKTANAKVFLSHLAKHKIRTLELSKELEYFGMSGFVAHEDIEPTEEWQDRIEEELLAMDGFVALLAEGFKESSWCDQEVGAAVGLQVPFISIKQEIDPYGFIAKYQALPDDSSSSKELAKQICELFLAKPNIGPKITASLVQQLVASNTYDRSVELVKLIRDSSYLTADDKELMQSVAKTNNQVFDAFENWGQPSAIALPQVIDDLPFIVRPKSTDNWFSKIVDSLLGLNKITPG